MKRLILACIIAIQLFVIGSSSTVSAAEVPSVPKKIGVLELDNKTIQPRLGNLAAAAMMVHLLKLNSCDIVDQDVLNQTFEQLGQRPKGVVDPAIASAIGSKIGLDYIIMGNIVSAESRYRPGYWNQTKYGPQYVQPTYFCSAKFEVMLLDVKESRIIWNETYIGRSNATTDLEAAMEDGGYQTARRIYQFIPLLGSITQIDGNKFHINLGLANGIKNGDLFSPSVPNVPTVGKEKKAEPAFVLKVIEVNDTDCIAVLSKGKLTDIKPETVVSKQFRTDKGLLGFRKAVDLKKSSN